MISRRHLASALLALGLAGCHEDPTVTVLLPSLGGTLNITTDGGSAMVTPTNTAGSGKDAGAILARVLGDMNLGGGGSVTPPTVPAAPTIGNPPSNPTSGSTDPGTIIITGTPPLTPGAPVTFGSTNGDLVVSGILQTTDVGVAQQSITLNAPAGTVYITGSVITSSADGNPTGDAGGNVTINAARIVVTGTIDTHGEANGAAPGTGGNGGNVTLAASTGAIYVMGSVNPLLPTINTAGGTGTTGGAGGNILLGAGNKLYVFGNLTADGGAATDSVGTPSGGNGGAVTLNGKNGVDVLSAVSLHGGDSIGGGAGADGGIGNDFSINSAAPVRIYGSVITRGGTATATGGAPAGGAGGNVLFGIVPGTLITGTPLESLELGSGTWSTSGGSGADSAGNAKGMAFLTDNGTITVGSILNALGGSATGPATSNTKGGDGGSISMQGDGSASSATNHPLRVLSVVDTTPPGGVATSTTVAMTTTGGAGTGTGAGGLGGGISLQCGGDLSSAIVMTTTGGAASGTGAGGQAGAISLTVSSKVGASGNATLSGVFSSIGGASAGGAGGGGGSVSVDLSASNPGSITCSATITTSGSSAPLAGAGGLPGNVKFSASLGDITLSGAITAVGGSSLLTPANGANLTTTCGATGGSINCSSVINLSGGSSLAASLIDVVGGPGGNLLFQAPSAIGSITLVAGSSIQSDGGVSTGAQGGGGGGMVNLLTGGGGTAGQFVSMFGSILARGGTALGTGPGGLGGQVGVNTSNGGNGTGGDITLQPGALIDVSGGPDTSPPGGGGSARNNGGLAPDPTTPATLAKIAVVLDADGSFANYISTIPGVGGIVQNLGQILARGVGSSGNGGDVLFAGKGPLGPLTATDAGNLVQTGVLPTGNGQFAHN
jgi:hypothetical protein